MSRPGEACYRNAVAFNGFVEDVAGIGGKVTVGLSGNRIAGDKEPANDLVIIVSAPGKKLTARVTGRMGDTLVGLRDKLGLVTPS